jgi:hypothetical protein
MKRIRFWVRIQSKKILIMFVRTKRAFRRESKETVIAAKILTKLLKDEDSVSEDEIEFLKNQSADLGKAIGLLGLQFVPGSSIGIIALEKIGKKKGFTVFPKENDVPDEHETTSENSSSPAPSSL